MARREAAAVVTYTLGVDLGTTYCAVAVHRNGMTEIVPLTHRAMITPSAVFVAADGEVLVGDAALRRGVVEPGRLATEFKRRLGDPVPILLGGSPFSAVALTALLLERLAAGVAEQQGGPPSRTVLTFPANWGPHKQGLLSDAVRSASVREAGILTEPEAAAIWYASAERVAVGETVAVYDLGGGTFDAAVLRKAVDGFEVLGTPQGIDRLGGIDVDEAIFRHVCALLEIDAAVLTGDEAGRRDAARLRAECVDAKEALSSDTAVTIPVALPGLHVDVRLTRSEVEAMVRPVLEGTIVALREAIRSAELETDDIDRVLLVGGASRMPVVGELVTRALQRPFFVDAHPKHVVALGAALAAASRGAGGSVAPLLPPPPPIEKVPWPDAVQPPPPPDPPPAPPAPPPAPKVVPPAPSPMPGPGPGQELEVVPEPSLTPTPEPGVMPPGPSPGPGPEPEVVPAAPSLPPEPEIVPPGSKVVPSGPAPMPGSEVAAPGPGDVGSGAAAFGTPPAAAGSPPVAPTDRPASAGAGSAPGPLVGGDRSAGDAGPAPVVPAETVPGASGGATVGRRSVGPGRGRSSGSAGPLPVGPEVEPGGAMPAAGGVRGRWRWVAVPAAVVVLGMLGVVVRSGGGDDDPPGATAAGSPTTTRPVVEGVAGGEAVDLAMLNHGMPEHIDPALAPTQPSTQIVDALYDGLTTVDVSIPDDPHVVPQVAETYTTNDDASVWTFTIREGLRFSDGTPVVPSAFVRGWERATQPGFADPAAVLFEALEGGAAKLAGTADTITGLHPDDDAMTLEVQLAAPLASFDALVAFQLFMPMPEAVDTLADQSGWENDRMVGNGPFMMASPRSDQEIVLVPNPEWDGTAYDPSLRLPEQPFLERVTFRVSPDPETAYQAFEDGGGQVAFVPGGAFAEAAQQYPNTFDGPDVVTYHLQLAWEHPDLGGAENRLLRQAISQAIDRDAVNEALYGGTAQVASGITPPSVPGSVEGLCDYCEFDPAVARAAFAQWQAGGNELDEPIRIQSSAGPGSGDVAVGSMVEDLNAAGISAVEETIPPEEYWNRLAAGDCVVCPVGALSYYLSYDDFLMAFFHSDAVDDRNYGRFRLPSFDQLVDEARATPDLTRRADLLQRAERQLLDDETGVIPILWHTPGYVYSDQLAGLPQTGTGLVVWERIYLDPSG